MGGEENLYNKSTEQRREGGFDWTAKYTWDEWKTIIKVCENYANIQLFFVFFFVHSKSHKKKKTNKKKKKTNLKLNKILKRKKGINIRSKFIFSKRKW